MDSVQAHIKETLISLLSGISNSDGALILKKMEELDALLSKHKDSLDPQLKHFMQNRSYPKALAYLGGETPKRGTCAPKTA